MLDVSTLLLRTSWKILPLEKAQEMCRLKCVLTFSASKSEGMSINIRSKAFNPGTLAVCCPPTSLTLSTLLLDKIHRRSGQWAPAIRVPPQRVHNRIRTLAASSIRMKSRTRKSYKGVLHRGRPRFPCFALKSCCFSYPRYEPDAHRVVDVLYGRVWNAWREAYDLRRASHRQKSL